MDIKLARLAAAMGLATILAGCSEEKVPEPTADNCAPEMYEKKFGELVERIEPERVHRKLQEFPCREGNDRMEIREKSRR